MSDAASQRMKVSREGIVLIKSFEGFRPRAIQRQEGGWIIGYGHTLSAREGATVSEADAELLLRYDLLPVEKTLNETVPPGLNQHQFDALVSFVFSVGVDRFVGSDVRQRLSAGARSEAGDAMMGWPEPVLPQTSLRRRAAERALFAADPSAPVALSDLLTSPLETPVPAVATAPASVVAPEISSPEQTAPEISASAMDEVSAVEVAGAPMTGVRYAGYSSTMVGALPLMQTADPRIMAPEIANDPAGHVGLTSSDAGQTSVPFIDVAPLVLTPANEAPEPAVVRPLWTPEQRGEPDLTIENGLFGEELTLTHGRGSILGYEREYQPSARFGWGEAGAFIVMGTVGLVAFGASMAAFRLASGQADGGPETTMIAWVLALLGAGLVGLSSFNLYRKWGLQGNG